MKNKYILFSASAVLLLGLAAFSFAGNGEDEKKKKKVEKKIEVTNNNGQKTVTIETTEDGKTKKEVYTGKEAEEYLQKNEATVSASGSCTKMIRIKIDDKDIPGTTGKEDDVIMFYNFNDSVFNSEELKKEMEKIKKELEEKGIHFDFDLALHEECMKNMQNKCMAYAYAFDTDDMDMHTDSMMKTMDIDIRVSDENTKGEKKVVVSKVIIINDNNDNKTTKKKSPAGEEIKLSPNPADDSFLLEFEVPGEEKAQITVTDINGKIVLSETVSGSKIYKKQVNSSSFADGTYILNITQGDTRISKKIVIQ
ncbi:MAG: T9SS type A sorting domain-containing protein [Bacteroidota bacterium]